MSRTATTRDEMLAAIHTITAGLNGSIVDVDELDTAEGPIRVLYIGERVNDLAAVLKRAVPRMVHRGIIFGEADSHQVACATLPPKVRTNLGRWVWSQPWRPEDLGRLQADHPDLVMEDGLRQQIGNELWPFYQDYITHVSPYDMAMSLESAVFLLHLCRMVKPATVTDFGSGFSSFLFRYYGGAAVTSVDDDPAWLAKTRAFCNQHLASVEGAFNLWPNHDTPTRSQSIVFHDLAGGELRNTAMPFALAAATRFAVVDDCQVSTHRDCYYRLADTLGYKSYSLIQTHDHIQRIAMLGVR